MRKLCLLVGKKDYEADEQANDCRGFLLGPIIALRLGCAFVPVRKSGKLPGEVLAVSYKKEYGTVSMVFTATVSTWGSVLILGEL